MANSECAHHWILEDSLRTVSMGVCKHCGAQREFWNNTKMDPGKPKQRPIGQAMIMTVEMKKELGYV